MCVTGSERRYGCLSIHRPTTDMEKRVVRTPTWGFDLCIGSCSYLCVESASINEDKHMDCGQPRTCTNDTESATTRPIEGSRGVSWRKTLSLENDSNLIWPASMGDIGFGSIPLIKSCNWYSTCVRARRIFFSFPSFCGKRRRNSLFLRWLVHQNVV